jgi:hypothetical protein
VGAGAGSFGGLRCGDVLRGAGAFPSVSAHTTLVRLTRSGVGRALFVAAGRKSGGEGQQGSSELDFAIENELKSLILAQIERWRHALHMQVERCGGATLLSVANG